MSIGTCIDSMIGEIQNFFKQMKRQIGMHHFNVRMNNFNFAIQMLLLNVKTVQWKTLVSQNFAKIHEL